VLFPERCIGCDKPGSALCAICERTITTKPMALSGTTATLFDYKNPLVKKAVWALKYKRKKSLGKYFGTALYREFFKQLAYGAKKTDETIILLPVPGSAKAVATRGYNHAGVIASSIVDCAVKDQLKLVLRSDILYKQKEVAQQVAVGERGKRKENVENLFAIKNGKELTGKTVILIDDVITTGATVADAKRALREFKPKRILAIAVAH